MGCERCGSVLHTGEARVVVGFTLDELEDLAFATSDAFVRQRLLCAIGLLDAEREQRIRSEVSEAWVCARCGFAECVCLITLRSTPIFEEE